MLSDLRQYITKRSDVSEQSELLRFFCERCMDEDIVIRMLQELSISLDEFEENDISLFTNIACNYHFIDILGSEEDMSIIFKLIAHCFSKKAIVQVEGWEIVDYIAWCYSSGNMDDEFHSEVIDFIKTQTDIGEILDILMSETLSDNEMANELDDLRDENTGNCVITFNASTDKEDPYAANFEFFMNLCGAEELILSERWWGGVAGWDEDNGYSDGMEAFLDFKDGRLNEVLDKIYEISPSPLRDLSQYENVFDSIGNKRLNEYIINSIMNIKKSKLEVIF